MKDIIVRRTAMLRALGHFAPLAVLCATATFGFAATPAGLAISTEIAPPGGWAQIKIYAATPMAIASGHLVLNLDATAFGTGAMVGVFGANGDAEGLATTTGSKIDVQFSSATGGIGQLAGLPVLVVSVPVLATASGTATVSATSPDSSVTVQRGSVTFQGRLSVQKVYAGMGVIPAGTVVPVHGSGFTSSTTVTIDGVEIASTTFVSPDEVDVTLGGAAELVGKRARVIDSGVEFDYFCFQPNDPVNFPERTYFGNVVASVQPLFPIFAATGFAGYSGIIGGVVEVQNPNATAASVVFSSVNSGGGVSVGGSAAPVSIPAGSWAIFDAGTDSDFGVNSSLPVRVVPMWFCGDAVELPVCLGSAAPVDDRGAGASPPVLAPSSLAFAWQMGSSILPGSRTVSVAASYAVALAATVTSGASWLSVTMQNEFSSSLSVSVNPSQLPLGTYQGSVLLTQSYGPPVTLPVTLTVTDSAVPIISTTPSTISFTVPEFNSAPYSRTIAVTSDFGSASFTVTPVANVAWLKISPLSGTTPAMLTVTWDAAVTSQFYYQQNSTPGSIVITGLANQVTIPATFNVTGLQTFQTYLGLSGSGPNGLSFSAQTGSAAQTQTINFSPAGAVSVVTNQPWMTAAEVTGGSNQTVTVTVNPAGLAAGVYTGTVTLSEPGIAPIAVPVMLGVWSSPPQLTISQSSFTFVQVVGELTAPYQYAEVDSGGVPVPLTFLIGASWLDLNDPQNAPTPAPLTVLLANPPGAPGEYLGSFTVESPGSSVYVPVTLLVEPGPASPPVVSQVVNSASGIAGGVSPGEILTVRGYSVGASATKELTLGASGLVSSSLNGLKVTFDGQAAPLIYTSANQTNLIVPYEVAGKASTVMQVTYVAAAGTFQTNAWVLPVVEAAPGVFTIEATGTGQGAIVNEDGTVNSATNPAARGSIVSIYATGEGQTSPAGVTGSVTGSGLKMPVLPVTVTIGGIAVAPQYAGSAPDSIAGLLQVNAVVPQGVATGSAVPITLTIGETQSQAGVTIAVK
jgi:uncharacterized protein (TIGR03437 family)